MLPPPSSAHVRLGECRLWPGTGPESLQTGHNRSKTSSTGARRAISMVCLEANPFQLRFPETILPHHPNGDKDPIEPVAQWTNCSFFHIHRARRPTYVPLFSVSYVPPRWFVQFSTSREGWWPCHGWEHMELNLAPQHPSWFWSQPVSI